MVIAGTTQAAKIAAEYCKEQGAKRALPLAVSVPSHCALMQPAADQLAVMLESIEFSAPTIPVINNVDVAAPVAPDAIKLALVKQLYSPVRWTETVLELAKNDVSSLYEIGPGKVLTGLVKRIDKNINGDALNSLASLTAQA